MQKIISKRIKISKKGKLLRRAMGLGHFRSKKRAAAIKRKKSYRSLSDIKVVKKIVKTKKIANS